MEEAIKDVIFDGGNDSDDILVQFISSNYHENNTLLMDRFLDRDRTIDIEKLELAIILLVEHMENSIKSENPIYINLGNMDEYAIARGIVGNLDRIIEESTFILGFCQAVATEAQNRNEIIVRFKGKDNV